MWFLFNICIRFVLFFELAQETHNVASPCISNLNTHMHIYIYIYIKYSIRIYSTDKRCLHFQVCCLSHCLRVVAPPWLAIWFNFKFKNKFTAHSFIEPFYLFNRIKSKKGNITIKWIICEYQYDKFFFFLGRKK